MTLTAEPRPKRWTKAEYHSLLDWAGQDRLRYELIDGEIIEMPPQKDEHSFALSLVDYTLREAFQKGFVIKIQSPLDLSATSEPEPDVMVIKGALRNMRKHPKKAVLVVEIAMASLGYDRDIKGSLYASRNVQDYWIVNLRDHTLEVHRQPERNAARRFGHGYGSIQILNAGQTVTPLAAPNARIKVADLVP